MKSWIFCYNRYVLVTLLNPEIFFVFNAQIKTTVENIFHNRAEKNMSLDIAIISNEPIKYEIVNACNHRLTNNVIILLASLDESCRNWCFYWLWRFSITNSSIFSLSFFCRVFPLALFFSYLFSFRVLTVTNDMTSVIRLYNRLLSKLVLFKTLEIWILRRV